MINVGKIIKYEQKKNNGLEFRCYKVDLQYQKVLCLFMNSFCFLKKMLILDRKSEVKFLSCQVVLSIRQKQQPKDPWEKKHLGNQENSQAPFMVYYPARQNERF